MKKSHNWSIYFSFLILFSSCYVDAAEDKQKIEDLNIEIGLLKQRVDSLIHSIELQQTVTILPNDRKKSISSNKKKVTENKIQPLVNVPVATIPVPSANNTTTSTSDYTPTKKSQSTYSSRCQASRDCKINCVRS